MKIRTNILLAFLLASGNILAQTNLPSTLDCNTTLTSANSPYVAQSDIVLNNGCTLTVEKGVEIQMAASTHLIIKGKADFQGTAAQPIHIHAKDSTWGNIFLDSTILQKCSFNYVIIENATHGPNPSGLSTHYQEAAISGYYSLLEINNCVFKNNWSSISIYRCNKALIKNCRFDSTNSGEKIHGQWCEGVLLDSCVFYYTFGTGDAIDFDASQNTVISNNYIYGGDADGIDIGQLDSTGCTGITMTRNFIYDMADKGITNGEWCKNLEIDHNVIVGCDVAIGAKAGAYVYSDHNTLYGNRIGVKSYDHLDGWGPGHLTVTNSVIVASIDSACYKDPTADLAVSYSISNTDTLSFGNGNMFGDPLFLSVANRDFHLTSLSPCIDKGDPNGLKDPDNSIADMGAFYFDKLLGEPQELKQISNKIFISPNPAHEQMSVKYYPSGNSILMVFLRNIEGQVIYSENYSSFSGIYDRIIDLSFCPQGVFFLEIISGNEYDAKMIIRD